MADQPDLPVPISAVAGKYLLFDIEAVTWLRRTHHLCGVFIGTLPQNPAQNVFLGLPVEIMPEEAQLLVEKGVGYIVDDAQAHDSAMRSTDLARRNDYLDQLRADAEQISAARAKEKEIERVQKMKHGKSKRKPKDATSLEQSVAEPPDTKPSSDSSSRDTVDEEDSTLFDSTSTIKPQSSTSSTILNPSTTSSSSTVIANHTITPTTSLSLIPTPSSTPQTSLPQESASAWSCKVQNLPKSYPLYRHLNSLGYFQTPGLRFGCQYCVYPGDPLRFHSHFLAVGVDWEEEIDLMDIVAGGRLGTGVKKGWLFGGEEPSSGRGALPRMRTFSVEWAGM